ncbi:MAG: hypothetical protein AB1894_11125 [Chloroflexota bacterium]
MEMEEVIHLTSEDMLMLEPALDLVFRRCGRKLTLEYLSRRWSRFVRKVEQGYPYIIDEYTNELTIRDIFQMVMNNCPPNIYNELSSWINGWDERFIQATEKVEKPLLPFLGEEEGWWWFRVPLNPGEEMKRSLENWWS